MKILITTSSFGKYDPSPLQQLRTLGFDVEINPHGKKLTTEQARQLYTADVVGVIAGTEAITEDVLAGAGGLKVISRCGSGMDNVDQAAAQRRGVRVYRSPGSVADAVAELTVGLAICGLRGIAQADRAIRHGTWLKPMGTLLKGKTWGLIGCGSIGRRVAQLVTAWECSILAYDSAVKNASEQPDGIVFDDLKGVLCQADVVSIHVPYTKETAGMISENELSWLSAHAFLVNAARGGIVDEQALYDVLNGGRIAGAALDVFEREPYTGPFVNLDNVILTSHIGSYAREARIDMENEAVSNLIDGLKEQRVVS